MITPNLIDVCNAINVFMDEHNGEKPTVVLVSGKVYNKLKEEMVMNSSQLESTDKHNDNTEHIMDVRVVVTESIKSHKDVEVL